MVTVLVADDHPLYREALARTVGDREGLELIGEAQSGEEALAMIRELRPDVAVLDVKMPGLDGVQIVTELGGSDAPTRVLLLSGYVAADVVYDAIAKGARAYLSKLTDAAHICDAIFAVSEGESVLPPEVQTSIAGQIRQRSAAGHHNLTPREQQILELTADGHSGPDIAKQLSLSPGTVKTHLRHIYEKLGVSDRAAAVAEAMRRGLLRDSSA